jgi:hypothetical protein
MRMAANFPLRERGIKGDLKTKSLSSSLYERERLIGFKS